MADKGKDGKSSIVKRFDYMLTRKATQMNEPTITIVGNLSSNPEMRFTPNGVSVATFNVASNPRSKVDGEWVDGTTVFLSVTCWRDIAVNVCESMRKGDPVMVIGRFTQQTWTDKDTGKERRKDEIQGDMVGVPLTRHTVKITKVVRDAPETTASKTAETSGAKAK
jgi:single-strand DNA-binding protein